MAAAVELRPPEWDLYKSQYPETDEFPLMTSPGPVMTIVAFYLLFVLKIGPSLMTKREPMKLTSSLLIYNAIQVLISVYLVQRYFFCLLRTGFIPKTCYMAKPKIREEILIGIWLYFAAKITELLDTVFFVVRKKDNQVTFLHLYHHTCMVVGTWAMLKYSPTHTVLFIGFLNSLVHVFMYTYYGLAALGPKVAKYLTWKKYMTTFQLVQFVSILIQYCLTLRVSECPPSKGMAIFIAVNTFFFLILFTNFYFQSYTKTPKKTALKVNDINTPVELKINGVGIDNNNLLSNYVKVKAN